MYVTLEPVMDTMLSRIFRAQYERGLDSTGSEYVQWLIYKNTWREEKLIWN
jgi:hypothetical protein